jgi:hypothetical protein
MPFIGYLVAIAVAIGAVLLELELLVASPPPNHTAATASTAAKAPAKPASPKPNGDLTPIYPASPGGALPDAQASTPAAAPDTPTSTVVDNAQPRAEPIEAQGRSETAAAGPVRAEPVAQSPSAGRCDVRACASAYRSFRESDCTYQPFSGPRQFCDKTAQDTDSPRTTQAQPDRAPRRSLEARAEARCNVAVCSRFYSSFRESDCTYQPYDGGPRRLCER